MYIFNCHSHVTLVEVGWDGFHTYQFRNNESVLLWPAKEKCYQYWPTAVDEDLKVQDITVTLIDEKFTCNYVIRKMQITQVIRYVTSVMIRVTNFSKLR